MGKLRDLVASVADVLANNAFRDASSAMDAALRECKERLVGAAAAAAQRGVAEEAAMQEVRLAVQLFYMACCTTCLWRCMMLRGRP